MQPTTPFNTQSWTILAAEGVGWLTCAALIYWHRWVGLSTTMLAALVIAVMAYAFIRICSMVHWHTGAQRGEGIEQHFIQMKVVAVYGFLIAAVATTAHAPAVLVCIIAALLVIVSAINATLLYLYRKDTSSVPVNYYSHRKSTQEDA